ncbi:MAG: carbonic anhydrase [Anaerolineae bacterium]|nr:carbonic anhydrase [Anaerolineae bacterium]
MVLDEVLAANKKYVASHRPVRMDARPQKKVIIVTCMDARLAAFLEPALGLGRGDALWVKSAGATAVDDRGDVVRSVVEAIYALGAREVLVIGHTHCGMAHVDLVKITQEMRSLGVQREKLPIDDIGAWLGVFADVEQNVREVVRRLRASPLISTRVPVHGLVANVESGELKIVERGG